MGGGTKVRRTYSRTEFVCVTTVTSRTWSVVCSRTSSKMSVPTSNIVVPMGWISGPLGRTRTKPGSVLIHRSRRHDGLKNVRGPRPSVVIIFHRDRVSGDSESRFLQDLLPRFSIGDEGTRSYYGESFQTFHLLTGRVDLGVWPSPFDREYRGSATNSFRRDVSRSDFMGSGGPMLSLRSARSSTPP